MQKFINQGGYPIGNGGGTCKTIADVEKFIKTAAGAIEIGSITMDMRPGNTGTTAYNGGRFTLNSLGLPNPGKEYYEKHLKEMISFIHKAGKKAIVNIVGFSQEEYADLTKLAFECGADFVVLNYGCPNVWASGTQKSILSYNLTALKKITIYVLSQNPHQARSGKIGIKLSPIFDPAYIEELCIFLNNLIEPILQENALGFVGFITTQNTVANCFFEDLGNSVISPNGGLAGMAGKAVFPMALGQIKQFRSLLNSNIKIIGVGGVTSGEDAYKMMKYGADFVQVVSEIYFSEDLGRLNWIAADCKAKLDLQ